MWEVKQQQQPPRGLPQTGVTPMRINEKMIRNKVGLLNLAEEPGNVSKACQVMGFSGDTF